MSLINDALRRADQSKKSTRPEPSSGAPMQPVHPPARSDASSFGPILVILIALIVLLAGWFFLKGWRSHSELKTSATAPVESSAAKDSISPNQQERSIPVKAIDSNPIPQPNVPVVTSVTESPNVAKTNSANTNETPVVVTPPAPPPLKLQGIFFRVKNSTAMINGKPLMVGESVAGARVMKIEKEQVTVERDGQTLVLTLP